MNAIKNLLPKHTKASYPDAAYFMVELTPVFDSMALVETLCRESKVFGPCPGPLFRDRKITELFSSSTSANKSMEKREWPFKILGNHFC